MKPKRLTPNKKTRKAFDNFEMLDELDKIIRLPKYVEKIVGKLSQLEDREEKLGIDLTTFLDALLSEYIFVVTDEGIIDTDIEFGFNADDKGCYFNLDVCHIGHVYLKDYGKKKPGGWALTRRELE